MALYDDYFTNEDKPFAENLNDALLLSNVFDMTVPIQIPKMFSNSTWVSTTSPRKCGVAVLTLKDGLPTGISVGTDSGTGNSTLTGTGTVKLSFYPNFNSFGKFKSMTWENTGTIVVNLKTATGTTIASNISKGTIENQSSELRTLQEIVIEIVFTNATLKSFEVVMENKQQTRYGAEVGISDVTGLNNQLDSKVDKRVQITANSTSPNDLNNYTTTGFYYCNNNSQCEYISNLAESDKAFFLVVEDWGASNYTKQTITHYSTGKTYTRIRNAGNWGSWKQLINIDNASATAPLVDSYKIGGKTGTSTNYARADHQHTPYFSYCTGGETTACYVNLLEISVTESWNDRPITLTLQQRAKQTPTYVSIKLANVNISTTNYTIDKFVIWGNPMTLYLKQIDNNKWHLIAYKPANDLYYIYDLFSANGGVEFVGKNTKWGSSAPTDEPNAPLYTASYLVGATPFESTSSNIKENGTASVGSLNTVARADHIHPQNCVNNLTSTSTTAPLSANQGKTLNDTKVNVSDIKDNLTSTDTNKPLSAKQGKVLNDTKLNTSNLFNLVYPVGSIYMSVNSTSPQTLFGGTWEQLKDTFLLASGDTYSNGATGGSADATLVSHNHGTSESNEYFVTSEIETANNTRVAYSSTGNRLVDGQTDTSTSSFHHRVGTGYVGSSATGKNMPPYLVVNVWKRTA